ncbi:MAG: PhoX family protein [Steroidobacter sp.]
MNESSQNISSVAKDDDPDLNASSSPWFADIVEQRYGRRGVVKGGIAAAVTTLIAGPALAGGAQSDHETHSGREHGDGRHKAPRIDPGFDAVAAFNAGREDQVVVPQGYRVQILIPEGAPLTNDAPAYIPGDYNIGADREKQVGAHHDGMSFFPLARGVGGNHHGVLCLNFENIDQALLHPNGFTRNSDGSRPVEDEVRKEVASHGVGVVELMKHRRGEWKVVRSKLNRRITGQTPMELTGPARGSDLTRTKYSPKGTKTRGTLNNCANGYTPWGTYLTCEENWAGYFFNTSTVDRPREHSRYGVPSSAASTYGWGTRPEDRYARFNATPTTAEYYDAEAAKNDYRNEPNTFGWVVEIDPFNPKSTPKKRTALGRFGHEGAWVAPVKIGKPVVVYMGDDARGEYMYKFVSQKPYWPWEANGDDYIDAGTLYVARFNADGSGEWIALRFGRNGLTPEHGFASQADILINTRSAADYVLATRMDRPEWADVDERTGHVYLTLTNNSARGNSTAQPVDGANPRRGNPDGHIIRWREKKGDYSATGFVWDIFMFGGPTQEAIQALGPVAPYNNDPLYGAQVFPGTDRQAFLTEEATFNSPDGLWIDSHTGLVWVQTDGYSNAARGFGNQQMLAANPDTGVVKRFLVGPLGCEITGVTTTPDRRTMFVNIQHPDGQWPNINGETRPRSATLAITKDDGGVIGT